MSAQNRTERERSAQRRHRKAYEPSGNEGFFRSLVKYAPNVILFLSPDHRILEFNPEAERLYGRKREEVLGKDFLELCLPDDEREALAADIKRVLAGKVCREFASVVMARDGQERILNWNVDRVLDSDNEPIGVVAIGQDVTERQRAEEAVASEKRLSEEYINSLPGLFYVFDEQRFVRWNSEWEKITGYCDEELRGKYGTDFFAGQDKMLIAERMQKVFREGAADAEAELVTKDGRHIPYYFTGVRKTRDGKDYLVGLGIDISRRKRIEDARNASEQRLKILFESAPDAYYTHDLEGRLVDGNRAALELVGYEKEETRGKSFFELGIAVEADIPKITAAIAENRDGKPAGPLELTFRRKDASEVTVETHSYPVDIDGQTLILGIARDITERKQAEEALQREKDRAQKYLDIAGVMFVAFNAQGEVTLINQKGRKGLRYEQEEIIGRNWFDHFLPAGLREQVRTVFDQLMGGEIEPVEYHENPVLTKGGEERIIAWHNSTLRDHEGIITGILSSGEDITERKRAEAERARLVDILEATSDFVSTSTPDGELTYLNRAGKRLLGWPEDVNCNGQRIHEAHPDWAFRVVESEGIPTAVEKGVWEGETALLRSDGIEIPVSQVIMAHKAPTGEVEYLSTIIRDITGRKEAERRFRDYQMQLKSLASELSLAEERERRRIAAGIHDDIAQKLAMVKFGLQSLQPSLLDPDLSESLEKTCQLMDQIVADARSLTFDLRNPILHEIGLEAALKTHLEERVQTELGIECHFRSEGPLLSLDDDIKVVLFRAARELLANVVKHAHATTVDLCTIHTGAELMIVVEDNGVGFDPAQVGPHGVGQGGFGLFNIRERLEYFGGSLEAETGDKQGARIVMTVPLKPQGLAQ